MFKDTKKKPIFVYVCMCYVSAIIITGGEVVYNPPRQLHSNVEVYVPSINKSCSLPPLPEEREDFTQDQLTACGGVTTDGFPLMYCTTFSGGKWTNKLIDERKFHTSWRSPIGLVLLGGWPVSISTDLTAKQKAKSTTIISSSGITTNGFELKHPSVWVLARPES